MAENEESSESKPVESAPVEEDDESSGGLPLWMATYSDMVTLLFAFFVLLFAMSSTQQESFKELIKSLRSALGVQQIPEAGTREGLTMHKVPVEEIKTDPVDELGAMVQKELDDIVSEVRELVLFNMLGGDVRIMEDELGATFVISEKSLFREGDAEMTQEGYDVIRRLYTILRQFRYPIRIAGHTDDEPIHTDRFPSNWELSTARACTVVKYLVELGINPAQISAEGYAQYRPIATNETPEGKAQNRRVEIKYDRVAIEKVLDDVWELKPKKKRFKIQKNEE